MAQKGSQGRSTRARSAARASAARWAAPVRAGAEDDNESEDGRVFEDDLEEGDESDNHGGGGGGKGRGGVGGDGATTSEDDYVNPPALSPGVYSHAWMCLSCPHIRAFP